MQTEEFKDIDWMAIHKANQDCMEVVTSLQTLVDAHPHIAQILEQLKTAREELVKPLHLAQKLGLYKQPGTSSYISHGTYSKVLPGVHADPHNAEY